MTATALSYTAAERHAAPLVRRIERIDPFLLAGTLLLIGYGLVMTYSATFEDRTLGADASQFVVRGAVWASRSSPGRGPGSWRRLPGSVSPRFLWSGR